LAQNTVKQLGLATLIPLVLLSGPIVGYFLGSILDEKLKISPWGVTCIMLLGFIASVKETIQIIKKISKTNKPS